MATRRLFIHSFYTLLFFLAASIGALISQSCRADITDTSQCIDKAPYVPNPVAKPVVSRAMQHLDLCTFQECSYTDAQYRAIIAQVPSSMGATLTARRNMGKDLEHVAQMAGMRDIVELRPPSLPSGSGNIPSIERLINEPATRQALIQAYINYVNDFMYLYTTSEWVTLATHSNNNGCGVVSILSDFGPVGYNSRRADHVNILRQMLNAVKAGVLANTTALSRLNPRLDTDASTLLASTLIYAEPPDQNGGPAPELALTGSFFQHVLQQSRPHVLFNQGCEGFNLLSATLVHVGYEVAPSPLDTRADEVLFATRLMGNTDPLMRTFYTAYKPDGFYSHIRPGPNSDLKMKFHGQVVSRDTRPPEDWSVSPSPAIGITAWAYPDQTGTGTFTSLICFDSMVYDRNASASQNPLPIIRFDGLITSATPSWNQTEPNNLSISGTYNSHLSGTSHIYIDSANAHRRAESTELGGGTISMALNGNTYGLNNTSASHDGIGPWGLGWNRGASETMPDTFTLLLSDLGSFTAPQPEQDIAPDGHRGPDGNGEPGGGSGNEGGDGGNPPPGGRNRNDPECGNKVVEKPSEQCEFDDQCVGECAYTTSGPSILPGACVDCKCTCRRVPLATQLNGTSLSLE